jgi:hypothetical protein
MKSSANPPGVLGIGVNPSPQGGQILHEWMLEGLVGQVQQLRGVLLGQHVDREPEVHTATIDQKLVVGRVGSAFGPPVDHLPGQNPVPRQRHGCLLLDGPDRPDGRSMTRIGPHRSPPHDGSV